MVCIISIIKITNIFSSSSFCIYGCTDVRMYGGTDVRMYGCTDVRRFQMYGCTDVRLHDCADVRKYGCMFGSDAWMYGCTNVWMYGCTDVRMYGCSYVYFMTSRTDRTIYRLTRSNLNHRTITFLEQINLLDKLSDSLTYQQGLSFPFFFNQIKFQN